MTFDAPESPIPVSLRPNEGFDECIVPCRYESPQDVAFFRDMERLECVVRELMAELGITSESANRVNERLFSNLVVFPDLNDRQTLTRLIVEELTDPGE